jgi:hypothetical protein
VFGQTFVWNTFSQALGNSRPRCIGSYGGVEVADHRGRWTPKDAALELFVIIALMQGVPTGSN